MTGNLFCASVLWQRPAYSHCFPQKVWDFSSPLLRRYQVRFILKQRHFGRCAAKLAKIRFPTIETCNLWNLNVSLSSANCQSLFFFIQKRRYSHDLLKAEWWDWIVYLNLVKKIDHRLNWRTIDVLMISVVKPQCHLEMPKRNLLSTPVAVSRGLFYILCKFILKKQTWAGLIYEENLVVLWKRPLYGGCRVPWSIASKWMALVPFILVIPATRAATQL